MIKNFEKQILQNYFDKEDKKYADTMFSLLVESIAASKQWDLITQKFDSRGRYGSLVAINGYLHRFMTDDELYRALVRAYVRDSTDFQASDIIRMKEVRPKNYLDGLPDKYKGQSPLTVWRASEASPELVPPGLLGHEFSWTLDFEVAGKHAFQCEAASGNRRFIYQALIEPEDIIAFSPKGTAWEQEQEVIQFQSVKNVEYVPLTIEKRLEFGEKVLKEMSDALAEVP